MSSPPTNEMGFTDFRYKKVFQVNVEFLEKLSGLSFRWQDVKNLKVPKDKRQLKKIRAVRNSDGAAKMSVPAAPPTFSTNRFNKLENSVRKSGINLILP